MIDLFQAMGGRKLVLGFAVITIGVCMDLLNPNGLSSNLLYLLCFISTSFFLANAASTMAYAKNERVSQDEGNSAMNVDLSALDNTNSRLADVDAKLEQAISGIATVSQAISHIIKKAGFDK